MFNLLKGFLDLCYLEARDISKRLKRRTARNVNQQYLIHAPHKSPSHSSIHIA